MAYDTFTPGVDPHFEYQKEVSFRTLTAGFGDGYKQETGDGLNATERKPSLLFSPITGAQADTIETFLIAKKGYTPFLYTLPDEATARQWKCKGYSRTPVANDKYSISVTLEEDFSIA